MKKMMRLFLVIGLVVGFLSAPSGTARASIPAILTVNSTSDADSVDGICTLREAVQATQNNADYHECTHTGGGYGNNKIQFSIAGDPTITLGSDYAYLTSGSTVVDGLNSGNPVVIDANGFRPFYVNTGVTLELDSITIKGASLADPGGAVRVDAGGSLNVHSSSFFGNSSPIEGGAIYNGGTTVIANSTFGGNSSLNGGAIMNNSGALYIYNSTFYGNTATSNGSSIATWKGGSSHPLTTVYNTIMISGNAVEDCWNGGRDTSLVSPVQTLFGDHNLIASTLPGTVSCASIMMTYTDPVLGTLAGSPSYYPISSTSSAFETGNDNSTYCTGSDQRGVSRPQGLHCDIGAYEYVDSSAPSVTAFTADSISNSLSIPVSLFTAADNLGVTGYIITQSASAPLVSDGGWTASAPTSYSVASEGSYTLYAWAKDAWGNISAEYTSQSVVVDTSAPSIDSFNVADKTNQLDIPIFTFTASDNNAVTGYLITESSATPSASVAGWTLPSPTTYTVLTGGTYTLYPWAKDAAGNVSPAAVTPSSVHVDTTLPEVTSFTAPASSTSLDIPITLFTASDNYGMGQYLITTSSATPLASDTGWTSPAPSTYSVLADGSYTLYPWAKDSVGNISALFATPVTVTVDTTAPDVAINSKPTNPSTSSSASFTFSSTEGTATFKCSLDGGAEASCTSGVTYTSLACGSHTFSVRARDTFGNVSAPATYTWLAKLECSNNGGFNTYTPSASKIPAGWVKSANFASTDGKDKIVKKEGSASVKLTGKSGKTKTLTQTITLNGNSGDVFNFSFWVRGASIPKAGICKAEVMLKNGAVNAGSKSVNCAINTYLFQKKSFVVTASGTYTSVIIKFTYGKSTGTVWFDGVSLKR